MATQFFNSIDALRFLAGEMSQAKSLEEVLHWEP